MDENQNVVVNEVPPVETKPSKKDKLVAGFKEFIRKQVVALKRNPQRIPLFCIVICSVLWLIWLFTFSQAVSALLGLNTLGLMVFVNTLLSILIIPLFLNAFPKRKKPNYVFIALVFVFMATIIVLDIVYRMQIYDFLYVQKAQTDAWIAERPFIDSSCNLAIVHVVLIAISALSLALIPVYAPLIKKINTAKNIESNEISGSIDVEDDE